MEKVKRSYTGKDVDMLTAIATIVEAAITHKDELTVKRPGWKDPFLPTLKSKIETVTQDHLGIDSLKDLRQSTQVLVQIQKQALTDLTSFSVNLRSDFRKEKTLLNEMLTSLGYAQHYTAAKNKNQQKLVDLLFQFKRNMTNDWESAINAKGIDPALISNIKGYADTLHSSNVTQESFKTSGTEITDESITAFNEIYAEVMDVAKVSTDICKGKPAVKAKFNYSKTLKALSSISGNTEPVKPPVPKPA